MGNKPSSGLTEKLLDREVTVSDIYKINKEDLK